MAAHRGLRLGSGAELGDDELDSDRAGTGERDTAATDGADIAPDHVEKIGDGEEPGSR